ncbi:galactokinase [candidate division KSB1 bacterium]|nr:galactokinase [candidate division KSB1 bacterium]
MRATLERLYGDDTAVQERQIERYRCLAERFRHRFGEEKTRMISVPGRTEIGGNHTDHNHGRVLAAAVQLDALAVVAPTAGNRVALQSEGYADEIIVELDDLRPRDSERETTTALIRGVAARMQELGYTTGGFNACVTSDVAVGSGLSSSAAIEVLIAAVFSVLYNQNRVAAEELAMIGRYAENVYFGKPCGLMDQMTCAVGGVVAIDFAKPEAPEITRIEADLAAAGLSLVVVDSGGHHADLTPNYASIPQEMKSVAKALGGQVCRDIDPGVFLSRLGELRPRVGDRALLRALHFYAENRRVVEQVAALREGRVSDFMRLVNESGQSSGRWLQNSFASENPHEQGINLALALTEDFIRRQGCPGACRVHGGGFAGTILAIVPHALLTDYSDCMQSVFGANCLTVLRIRPVGVFLWP